MQLRKTKHETDYVLKAIKDARYLRVILKDWKDKSHVSIQQRSNSFLSSCEPRGKQIPQYKEG